MTTSILSSKYQVVIPLAVRKRMQVHPGQEFQVVPYRGRIELIPLQKAKHLRGFAKGISSVVEREKDRL